MNAIIGLSILFVGFVCILSSYFFLLEQGYSAFHFFSYDRMTPLGKKLWMFSVALIVAGVLICFFSF